MDLYTIGSDISAVASVFDLDISTQDIFFLFGEILHRIAATLVVGSSLLDVKLYPIQRFIHLGTVILVKVEDDLGCFHCGSTLYDLCMSNKADFFICIFGNELIGSDLKLFCTEKK